MEPWFVSTQCGIVGASSWHHGKPRVSRVLHVYLNIVTRMYNETETEVSDVLYDMLGYDSKNKKVRLGMLAEKTHPYIKEKVVEMLISEYNFSQWEANEVLNKTWKDTPENLQIKMTGNLGDLFKQLKAQSK